MLKKIIICLIVAFTFTSCMSMAMKQAQSMQQSMMGSVDDDQMAMEIIDSSTLQKVIEVDANSNEIEDRLKSWIENNFSSEDNSSLIIQESVSEISGVGCSVLNIRYNYGSFNHKVFFDYKFEIKDGRTRFTIKEPYIYIISNDGGGAKMTQYIRPEEMPHLSRAIKEKNMVESIQDFIQNEISTDNNW